MVVVLSIPIKCLINTMEYPVHAKTTKMINTWNPLLTFQRSFSLSVKDTIFGDCKFRPMQSD